MATTIEHCIQHCRTPDLQNLLRVATEAALKAGAVLQERYDKPHQIRHKGAIDLVTEADLAAEELILDVLRDTLPEIKVLSEESDTRRTCLDH
jgi:myo-inositol-1(or 4)-monophosphatase